MEGSRDVLREMLEKADSSTHFVLLDPGVRNEMQTMKPDLELLKSLEYDNFAVPGALDKTKFNFVSIACAERRCITGQKFTQNVEQELKKILGYVDSSAQQTFHKDFGDYFAKVSQADSPQPTRATRVRSRTPGGLSFSSISLEPANSVPFATTCSRKTSCFGRIRATFLI